MDKFTRRDICGYVGCLSFGAMMPGFTIVAQTSSRPDPWPPDKLIQPADLARILQSAGSKPTVISVAFPVLYRQRHIVQALAAGPTSKPEGLAALRQTLSKLPKNADIVIYCGCCPMEHCPNIRPAYTSLATAGFENARVLNLPANLHTDWVVKGYPSEPAA